MLNGKGTYTFADGKEYIGEWKDGSRNGKELKLGQMVANMKGNGKMILFMEREPRLMQMANQ